MWVAKFETSGTSATTLASKPGVAAYRSPTIANAFTYTRNMETNGIYGWDLASGLNADGTFTTDTNNVDTHMMKNIEWGAVAYLTQSIYGKNDIVWNNPSTSYITGCAGASANAWYAAGCANYYDSDNGQQVSTTGNIYGIYDMSGGAWEIVMSNFKNTVGSSGFSAANLAAISDKYIDRYMTFSYSSSNFGDAMWETSNNYASSNAWEVIAKVIPQTN